MREVISQLDFSEEPPINIYDCVSRLVKHFGDQGATLEDLVGMFQKNITQWKAQSVSPALSNLTSVGCIKHTTSYGVKRYFHLKSFTELELNMIRARGMKSRKLRKEKELAMAREEGRREAMPKIDPSIPQIFGRETPTVVKGSKMLFALGEKDTVILEPKQAKELYEQLKAIFE